MNEFVRCNKVTGVHWVKTPVQNLRIIIKLKLPDDIISLPKFEDYTNDTSAISLEQNFEEFSFKWQEKSFSACDLNCYKDVYNCLTETELKYHELIKSKEIIPSKVFSYIHNDYYLPLPQKRKIEVQSRSYLECMNLDDAVGRIGNAFSEKTVSERHLFKSQENVGDEDDAWTAMHIVLDNSDYNEDTPLLKQEAILVSLYHNITHNYLIISPDLNKLETSPYAAETNTGEPLGYQYEVNLDFGDMGGGEELGILLTKLYKKWEKKHKHFMNFIMPVGKTQYFIALELISASEFDMGDMYIEYHIKLPEGIQCKDALTGRTHISESAAVDDKNVWHFGHLVDLCLEVESSIEPPPLQVYLEAISTDFWHRHRTEGYCWFPLPLAPRVEQLHPRCLRPEEEAGDRRFFLGGCRLVKHLEVLSKPELQNGDYTYTETGTIQIRHSVISQSPLQQHDTSTGVHHQSTASALLLGAEAALRKYRKARDRLAQATRED